MSFFSVEKLMNGKLTLIKIFFISYYWTLTLNLSQILEGHTEERR